MRARASALAALLALLAAPAGADDDTSAGTGSDGLWVKGVEHANDHTGGTRDVGSQARSDDSPSLLLGIGGCASADQAAGEILDVTFCPRDPSPDGPALTIGLIRQAFAELKLPAATLLIQPPDGLTLVNFDTNFYTTTTNPITRTITLLGQPITLEATPATYHWTFGDGEHHTTTEPGAPYPNLTITHNYLRKGSYRPTLTTTYTGRYRTTNSPWHQIPGTVTIDTPAQPLRAIEATPKLVAY